MEEVDLRYFFTPVKDQGKRNTCVAFAATAGHEYLRKDGIDLSEEFLYWGCKRIDGQFLDNGTTLCSAISTLKNLGQAKEENWPYDPEYVISPQTYFPSNEAEIEASGNKVEYGERIPIDINIVQKKIEEGYAIIIGVLLYKEFFEPQNGLIEYPKKITSIFGKHAILVVGWNSSIANGVLIIRNSWGESWGVNGYGFLTYEYFIKNTVDAWCFNNR